MDSDNVIIIIISQVTTDRSFQFYILLSFQLLQKKDKNNTYDYYENHYSNIFTFHI